jgi:hypothetical protein
VRRFLFSVGLAVMLAVGLWPTVSSGAVSVTAQLRSRLLPLSAFSKGWQEQSIHGTDSGNCRFSMFPGATATAEASYYSTGRSPLVVEILAEAKSGKSLYRAALESIDQCPSYSEDQFYGTRSPVKISGLGESSKGYENRVEGRFDGDFVIFRKGNVVGLVQDDFAKPKDLPFLLSVAKKAEAAA